MEVTIDLVKEGGKTERKTVTVKGTKVTNAIMNKIDKAVEKAFGDDPGWTRWNLISIDGAKD